MLPKLKLTVERWKWSDNYQVWVSTEGHIRDRNKDLVEPMINANGYPVIFNEEKQKFTNIHRIVLETWRPREDRRQLTVEHKDQNKRNPALRNLMWLTENENLRRAKYHDLGHGQQKIGNANKRICANGVTMTVEDAVTFIFNSPNLNGQFSKRDVRAKVNEVINSKKDKKSVFGVTFTEVDS